MADTTLAFLGPVPAMWTLMMSQLRMFLLPSCLKLKAGAFLQQRRAMYKRPCIHVCISFDTL